MWNAWCIQCCYICFKKSNVLVSGKVIVVKENNNITDEWLHAIGLRRPISLTISQCRSDKVTAKGLRDLFRNCSDSLEVHFRHICLCTCIYMYLFTTIVVHYSFSNLLHVLYTIYSCTYNTVCIHSVCIVFVKVCCLFALWRCN